MEAITVDGETGTVDGEAGTVDGDAGTVDGGRWVGRWQKFWLLDGNKIQLFWQVWYITYKMNISRSLGVIHILRNHQGGGGGFRMITLM